LSETFAPPVDPFRQEYSLPLPIGEVKAVDDGSWEVAGYASVWDVVDLGNDVVHKGAFLDSLGNGRKVRFLYGHDHRSVLGAPIELKEDEQGLHGRFRISKTRLGDEVHTLLKDGALDSFSIGYLARDFRFDEEKGVRHLDAIDLLEVSVVAVPMAPRALVTAVKGGPDGAAGLPFDALWQQLRDAFVSLGAGVTEAKALYDRRRADGREPTQRHADHLSRTLEAAEATLRDFRSLVQAPSKEEAPAEAKAEAEGLRLRLELARRRLQRQGVLEKP
jgi:HK97 family phage prohead protease